MVFAGAARGWRDVEGEKNVGDLGRQLEEQRKGKARERRTGGRGQNRT